MRPSHPPIEPQGAYPCPQCCPSHPPDRPAPAVPALTPIALTEALGCQHCQGIFVVMEGGAYVEQINTSLTVVPRWRWNGQHWQRLPDPGLPGFMVAAGLAVFLGLLPLLLNGKGFGLLWWVVVGLLVLGFMGAWRLSRGYWPGGVR